MAAGAMAMVLVGMVHFIGNQFAFDRAGFRVFVLCPARRQDIILGKNMAVAPLALGMGFAMALVIEVIYPMGPDYFLAALVQMVAMFLLFCTMANWMSILAPIPIAPGTMKMANPKFLSVLLVFAFMFILTAALVPTLLPLGITALLVYLGFPEWLPLCLLLTLAMLAVIAFVYRLALPWQGRLLQAKEQQILMVVTTKAD
jgi:hypothetical protein